MSAEGIFPATRRRSDKGKGHEVGQMTIYNVLVPVVALVEATSAQGAIHRLSDALTSAGFTVHIDPDNPSSCNAFESEDQTEQPEYSTHARTVEEVLTLHFPPRNVVTRNPDCERRDRDYTGTAGDDH